MNTAELKLWKNVSDSMEIKNDISGETSFDENGKRIFKPWTFSASCSEWKVGFMVRHRGADIWFWWRGHKLDSGLVIWAFDSSYNTNTGKRLRKDAEWNLRWKLSRKAELLSHDVSDVRTKAGADGSRLCLYSGVEWRIEPGDEGYCYLWIGLDYIACCESRLHAKVFIKFKAQYDQRYLLWQMHEDWVNFNMNMKKTDEVTWDAFKAMQVGFKYRGMMVDINDRGDLVFCVPHLYNKSNQ